MLVEVLSNACSSACSGSYWLFSVAATDQPTILRVQASVMNAT